MSGMRWPGTAALVVSVLLVAGCSEEASEEEQWADGVCSAWTELAADLRGLSAGLDVDSLSRESLEGLRTEVEDRVDAVRASAQDLVDAIADAPEGADEPVEDAQQELGDDAADVRAGLDAVGQALQELGGAATGEEVTGALSEAQTALTHTGQALSTLGETVAGYLAAADDTLRQAFDDAQSCDRTSTQGTAS
ncbi:hypothetical protein [Jiangella rhizosphaerae]|uniref:Uncharacterized protein n=1 Tax=Jiangella rhizosphaerae TaxID=2293569 RepID=A0A418KQ23_9ACTN|nr:hypothetical protein [Jiangella rhizosphaerae]RIQ21812.1 hypothetical protein DY240_14725 [Jiangella rhizosphaerae]